MQYRLCFCVFTLEVPVLTAVKAITCLTEQRALQRKKLPLTLKILLSSMILMALNLSPEFNINIIVCIPANECTCF